MKTQVLKWTGIPISVGLGPTKTLAKLANRLAKKNDSGCLTISQEDYKLIASVEIEDVWGVGKRLGNKLRAVGVSNALHLMNASSNTIRKLGGVVLERTQKELQGWPCLELEQCPQPKKNVCCSRAFGQPITSLDQIEEAVATHALEAYKKFANSSHWRADYRLSSKPILSGQILLNIQTLAISVSTNPQMNR